MGSKHIFLIGLVLVLFGSCSKDNVEQNLNKNTTPKINGVSFTASNSTLLQANVSPLKTVNASYVSLMPFGFVENVSSPDISYNNNWQWYGETTEGLKQYTSELRTAEVKIMIKPQLWISGGVFTGTLEMANEANWLALENAYENFILEYAKVAEELSAELFCIGTELEKFVINRPDYWNSLILKIKAVYSGKLTYAANWDEYKRVPFWGDLDFIGVDAYFPLSDLKSPSKADLVNGWKPYKDEIKMVQQQNNKPILFTEFGYRSVDFAAKAPWDSTDISGQINLDNQVNGLQVLYDEFWKEDWFAGGFLWKWFLDHDNAGGVNDNRFTPQNKPAEQLLIDLYEN